MYFNIFSLASYALMLTPVFAGPVFDIDLDKKWLSSPPMFSKRDLEGLNYTGVKELFDKRQCQELPMTISECTSCIPDGGESPPICQSSAYTHNGNSGEGSCEDKQAPFDDAGYCTCDGQVYTPLGPGTWYKDDACDIDQPDGNHAGIIAVDVGNGYRICGCDNKRGHHSMGCTVEFTCTELFFCACC